MQQKADTGVDRGRSDGPLPLGAISQRIFRGLITTAMLDPKVVHSLARVATRNLTSCRIE